MAKSPPVSELDFLKLSPNHWEFGTKLTKLGWPQPDLVEYAEHVCSAWFRLGEQHLAEAKKMPVASCQRAIYSRAYYAAYNASKGARYMANGFVSLKGDDHSKVSVDLAVDFPDRASWSQRLAKLYTCRLYADYDNWSDTAANFPLKAGAAISEAEQFIDVVRKYLKDKFKLAL